MRVFGVFLSLNGLLFILCEREKFYYFLFFNNFQCVKHPFSAYIGCIVNCTRIAKLIGKFFYGVRWYIQLRKTFGELKCCKLVYHIGAIRAGIRKLYQKSYRNKLTVQEIKCVFVEKAATFLVKFMCNSALV